MTVRQGHGRGRVSVAFAVAICAAVVGGGPAAAELGLVSAYWFEREIGAGVVWRQYLFNDLFGSTQSVSYIEVDLTNPEVSIDFPYLVTGRQRVSSMIPEQTARAVAGINGTYFNTRTGGHRTYLRIDGAEIPPGGDLFSPWGYEGAIALDPLGAPTIEQQPAGGWIADVLHPDILACGPLLVIDGVIPIDHLTAIGAHCTSRHPRSAVGVTDDDRLILLAVDGRTALADGMKCDELAEVMLELGCIDALNLDGGGSTTLWGRGEPWNGVLNFPSDNGEYDHQGERSCVNAVAIASAPAVPGQWDAIIEEKTWTSAMAPGDLAVARLVYRNIGTETWSADEVAVLLARPRTRTSAFADAGTWPLPSQPAVMVPATVPPGATGTFEFVLNAPGASVTSVYDEHFLLAGIGGERIGPSDSEAWMRIVVQPPIAPGTTFIVESRGGGQNSAWYSDTGMVNAGANCTAPGCTGDIGTRYGSTYRSVAGFKSATVAPVFPEDGWYRVYVAWGAIGSRRNPVTYHVHHAAGTETFHLDQAAVANTWVPLATAPYRFRKGAGGSVLMTNEDIDLSGSMSAGAVKFEYHGGPETPDRSYGARGLGPGDARPVVDGVVGPGEWDRAMPSAAGFVRHDAPGIPAVEDGSFRMLSDDLGLYVLFQMDAAYLAGYATPPPGYGFADLAGDRINFFFTPGGPTAQAFYRVLLSPNPSDGICCAWSQAGRVKTFDPLAGTDWSPPVETAYSHLDGVLTIEFRIPWTAFDYPGMEIDGGPAGGVAWGAQSAISNEIEPGEWEYVNWEPDGRHGYVFGEPFGALVFPGGGNLELY